MPPSVVLGMSGGIDSSMAGLLLKEQGYKVYGVCFIFHDYEDTERHKRLEDFCKKAGIPLEFVDLRKEFKKLVIDYFINEYLSGRTPNPCVVCNRVIKFKFLFRHLEKKRLNYIATGHYVRIKKNGEVLLQMGRDRRKSQEYFLARVEKEILEKTIFPLGEWTKRKVRSLAREKGFNFPVQESQEVCFIPEGERYHSFILKHVPGKYSGFIKSTEGEILGAHDCYFKYTIGQRQGLGISGKEPYYVVKIDAETRDVIIGTKKDVFTDELIVRDVYWYKKLPFNTVRFRVRIRYNHPGEEARVEMLENNRCKIRFLKPQRAVTPGQLAVFYLGEFVMGSGWIE